MNSKSIKIIAGIAILFFFMRHKGKQNEIKLPPGGGPGSGGPGVETDVEDIDVVVTPDGGQGGGFDGGGGGVDDYVDLDVKDVDSSSGPVEYYYR